MLQEALDRKRFEEVTGGCDDIAVLLVETFIEDVTKRREAMHEALQSGDCHQLSELAHALKGASANFGAQPVRETSTQLEMVAKAGELSECAALVDELEVRVDILIEALKAVVSH